MREQVAVTFIYVQRRFVKRFRHLCAIGILCFSAGMYLSQLKAQDAGSNAGQLWKTAQGAFGSADYAGAAKALQAIIQTSPTSAAWLTGTNLAPAPTSLQWMEPVFYMLGAAHYNASAWSEAVSTFNIYRQLFPRSPRYAQVTFSQAQADFLGGHPEDSLPLFTLLLPNVDYHAKALLLLVEADKRAGKVADAITLLESESSSTNPDQAFMGKIRIKLLAMYLENKDEEKALSLFHQIAADLTHLQDVTIYNALVTRLGDQLLAEHKIPEALSCYRGVRDNDQILALEQQQVVGLQRELAANRALIQADPLNTTQLQLDNKYIDGQIADAQKILTQYQTLPPVLPPLFLRIGRAYSLNEDLWEAGVVYRELMRRWPHCAETEAALYGSIVTFDTLKQVDRAQGLCQAYLTQFPQGKYADSVGFLRGTLAYDANDLDKAYAYFNESLHSVPNNPRREQIELILGDIKLRQQKFDEAVACYEQYQKDFPQGAALEQAVYRRALALFFGGKTDAADAAIHAYLQAYPNGTYAGDAEYRLGVAKFAEKKYDEVIADCQAWQVKYGNAGPQAEVLSLMGDAYSSLDKDDEAVNAYTHSYQTAQTQEVLNYSLFAAAKLLQKHAKWADIVKIFQDFIAANPDHPTVVSAVSWIGRADVKLGKVDEAEQFMATTAKQYLNDPTREAVDDIITQLAQLYARKHLNFAGAPPAMLPGQAPLSTPAPAPPSTAEEDPAKSLESILTIPDTDSKPTAQARIQYAQAELARLQRKPQLDEQILSNMARTFKPEDLSPIMLGQVGDCLIQENQPVEAATFYHYLIDEYGQSPVVDYAYNGLGQIGYNGKDYAGAEKYFSKALNKGLASRKLKEITLGEAQSLLALNRPDEAKPYFEQVASTRAWRGEATALSVFSLGEIQMSLGHFAEANAYYQRVFVAYQKYPAIQAKAYVKSAEAFEKLGKIPEAIGTYSEMLKNPNLASFPEASDAKQRLEQLVQK